MFCDEEKRKQYHVVINQGIFTYNLSGQVLDTESVKGDWIFVTSAKNDLYVNLKQKGKFHHSSFLAGGLTNCSGVIVVQQGKLKKLCPESGHYRPSLEGICALVKIFKSRGVDFKSVSLERPRHWVGPWPQLDLDSC